MQHKSLIPFLVVEDDEIDVMNMQRSFSKLHIINSLHFSRSAIEALRMIEEGAFSPPLALIVDLNMPALGGHDFIRKVRAMPDFQGTPIFVLTTSSMEADKKEAWELNVNGYFLKEMASEAFTRNIKAMVDFVNCGEWS